MAGRMPLHACWTLCGDAVEGEAAPAFSLPGADALAQFSDLLGGFEDSSAKEREDAPKGAPFLLPAMLPEDVTGEAELSCMIDFGALCADRAFLCFEHIAGSGEALLDGEILAHFEAGPLTLDLTDALRLSKKQTLTLRFDASRPAGVPGNVLLHTSGGASIESAALEPHADRETMTLRCAVHARRAGRCRLIAQPCTTDESGSALPARQTHFDLREGEEKTVEMTLSVPSSVFAAGKPYAPAAVRLLLLGDQDAPKHSRSKEKKPGLFARLRGEKPVQLPEHLRTALSGGTLCDSLTLMCGYPGPAARAYVPLTQEEAKLAPQELVSRAACLHIPALAVQSTASDALARALTLSGIQLVLLPPISDEDRARLARLPAVSPADGAPPAGVPLEASALRLASMVAMPRSISSDASPAELLREAAGRAVDPDAPDVRERLSWLRAVSVRLAAEAARQGQLSGPVCDPGEWNIPDIRDALRTAFAPLHLGALPMRGAWWALSRLSASLHAFLPEDFCAEGPMTARVSLESEEGEVLSSCEYPCPPHGGRLGVFEAALPDTPCVLTLSCRLMQGETVLEESELPVYVGLRGALEAAFS